jgi:hypothetical protein
MAAVNSHQLNLEEMVVKTQEVDDPQGFVAMESEWVALANVGDHIGVPVEMPPALVAALADINNTLKTINNTIEDVNGQLIQLKKQGDEVNNRLIIAEHWRLGYTRLFETVAYFFGVAHYALDDSGINPSGLTASLTSSGRSSPTTMATASSAFTFGSAPLNDANDDTGATPSTTSSPESSASEGDIA